MKAKSRNEDSALVKKIVRPIVIGACAGAIACLLMLLVMAAVMAAQNIPKAAVTPMAMVAAAFGSFIAGIVSAKISGERGLLYGAGARTPFVRGGDYCGICPCFRMYGVPRC